MIKIDFQFNKAELLRRLEARVSAISVYLKDRQDKTFKVVVDGKEYLCRYEVLDSNQVQLYAQGQAQDASSLVSPTLTLSLGSLLLPECMTLPGDEQTLADPDYEETKEISYNGLSNNEIKKIFSKIQEQGFLNILKESHLF